jgi:hypothetical protein
MPLYLTIIRLESVLNHTDIIVERLLHGLDVLVELERDAFLDF